MKRSYDDEITEELEKIGQSFQLSSARKEKMKRHIFQGANNDKAVRSPKLFPAIASLVVLLAIVFGTYTLLNNKLEIDSADLVNTDNRLTDLITSEQLPKLVQPEGTFLIEWQSDSMDRGNHDFDTSFHGKLIVTSDIRKLERGQVVYYKTPEAVIKKYPSIPTEYIGRVVGLSGETVRISNGQVYINKKLLDTFYGKATMHGMDEEQYFNNVDSRNIEDEQSTREYFNTNMSAVTVKEGTVFILVDQWWRGTDSRESGALPIEEIMGVVVGYEQ